MGRRKEGKGADGVRIRKKGAGRRGKVEEANKG